MDYYVSEVWEGEHIAENMTGSENYTTVIGFSAGNWVTVGEVNAEKLVPTKTVRYPNEVRFEVLPL